MRQRIGIIGGGAGAELSAEAIKQVSEAGLLGFAGGTRAKCLARRYQVRHFDSIMELLNEPTLDLVVIASPSDCHVEHSEQAIVATKHVLVEKPIALNCADAYRLIAQAHRSRLWLGVMHQYRYDPAHRLIFSALHSGWFGTPLRVDATLKMKRSVEYYSSATWRGDPSRGGGVLWNQAIHLLDLLLWWFGPLKPQWAATSRPIQSVLAEQSLDCVLSGRNGLVLTINASTHTEFSHLIRIEVVGTLGKATVENHALSDYCLDNLQARIGFEQLCESLRATEAWPPGHGHAALIVDAIRAMNGIGSPLASAEDGLRVVQLVEKLYSVCRGK